MRLLLTLFTLSVFTQPHKVVKTWYNKSNESTYRFYKDRIIKEHFLTKKRDTFLLEPIPEDYPDYSAVWYSDALHLTSNRGGLIYRIEKGKTLRIDQSYQHRKQHKASQFVYRDTLFRYGGYGFWRANNFFTYYDESTTEWEYYPTQGYNFPTEAFGGSCFLLGDTFYSVGGIEVDKFTGLEGETNKDIWKFDFITRKWTNLGKTAVNLSPYKIVQKDSLFYLFAHPINTKQNLVLDLKNNNVLFYNHNLTSVNIIKQEPAFFRGDSLYYFKNNQIYGKVFGTRTFANPEKVERLYFDQRTLFLNLTYAAILAFVIITLGYLWVIVVRMRTPRLVRGGIRNKLEFFPLSEEEEMILVLLQSKLRATTDDILQLIGRDDLSDSQNNKRKADAIESINTLMKKLVGKSIIKIVKDPNDKRQLIYYFKRNLIN